MRCPVPKLKCHNAEQIASLRTLEQDGLPVKIICDTSYVFFPRTQWNDKPSECW